MACPDKVIREGGKTISEGEMPSCGFTSEAPSSTTTTITSSSTTSTSSKTASFDQGASKQTPSTEARVVPMRLQKFLARAGVASRRGSENLMSAGRVRVNGQVVTELGSRVDPSADTVSVDGCEVYLSGSAVTLMLNKPPGYLTTMSDPFGRPTVADLVPRSRYPGLFPIGRLDLDTTGILLFSTDGELGNTLLHPRHHVDKSYIVRVEGRMGVKQLRALRAGVELEDGMTLPAEVELMEVNDTSSLLRITIHEGRKRQVRRMCEFVGHPVTTLHRSSFGPLSLGNLLQGEWRLLSDSEISALRGTARR